MVHFPNERNGAVAEFLSNFSLANEKQKNTRSGNLSTRMKKLIFLEPNGIKFAQKSNCVPTTKKRSAFVF